MSPKTHESTSSRGGAATVEQHVHMHDGVKATETPPVPPTPAANPQGWRSVVALIVAAVGIGVGGTSTAIYVTISSRPAAAAQTVASTYSDVSVIQSVVAGIKADQDKMLAKQNDDHDKIIEMRGDIKALLLKVAELKTMRK